MTSEREGSRGNVGETDNLRPWDPSGSDPEAEHRRTVAASQERGVGTDDTYSTD